MSSIRVIALFVLCLASAAARADTVQEGLTALQARNYAAAADALEAPNKRGEIAAMNNLAFLYVVGRGVDRDLSKALDLLTPMADAGWALAQYNLAVVYATQPDLMSDPAAAQEIATDWFRAAAKGGHVRAQFQLGVRSYLGTGTEKDAPAALAWLALARQKAEPDLVQEIDKLTGILRQVLSPQEIEVARALAKYIGPTLPDVKADGMPTDKLMKLQTAAN